MLRKIILCLCVLLLNVVVCSAEVKKGYYPSNHYDKNRAIVSLTTKNDAVEIGKAATLGIRFDKTYWFAKPFWSKKYKRYRPVYSFMVIIGDEVKHSILEPIQYSVDNNKLRINLSGSRHRKHYEKVKMDSFVWTYKTKNEDVYNPVESKERFIKDLLESKTVSIHFEIDDGKELQYTLSENELKDIRTIIEYDLYSDPQLVSQCPLAYYSPLNAFGF